MLAEECRAALGLTPEELATNHQQASLHLPLSQLLTHREDQATPTAGPPERVTPTSTPLIVGGMLPKRRDIDVVSVTVMMGGIIIGADQTTRHNSSIV